jgi:hypothetical protein
MFEENIVLIEYEGMGGNDLYKGQLISKCTFGVSNLPKTNKIFVRISALAS